jgi:hypothetical protein
VKVIGIKDRDTYICEVTHTELEKVFNKYYGNMPHLESGGEVDLGMAYNFDSSIRSVCQGMNNAMVAFEHAANVVHQF